MKPYRYFIFLILLFLMPSFAFATCNNPEGLIGEMRFDNPTEHMMMCKTSGWVVVSGPSSGGNSNATAINYNDCHQISTKNTALCNAGYFPVATQCSGNQGRCGIIKDNARYGIEGHPGSLLPGLLIDPSWASALCCQIVNTPNVQGHPFGEQIVSHKK